ncbi:MAG: response regulator [Candidatus Hydrogenedentes bacterium]|nr:response regulator [Candidatus Hydrogenedentota bacterium]
MKEPRQLPRALVVDDSQEFRALLSRALQREGVNCDVAPDGLVAEQMLGLNCYDILVTDLRMPRKHGHQLITDVMASSNPPMIVVMTGVLEARLIADLISRGVRDVIQKPLAFDVMAAKIKALFERRAIGPSESAGAAAGTGAGAATRVAEELGRATESMRAQLNDVTKSFESAIRDLERQKSDLEEGFHGSLRMLTNLFDKMGSAGGSHAGRVERMASLIGERLGLSRDEKRNLVFASLLHDVGQFGMPDAVRSRAPWALSGNEREIFQAYPVIGAMLLSEIRGADKVAEIVEAHAENFDGSGFPKQLKGSQIARESRIIRIADGCDTHLMFHEHEHPIEELRLHLLSGRGRAYDPEMIDAALASLHDAFSTPAEEEVMEVSLVEARPNLVLAENVYDEKGRFLARAGATLSSSMLLRLQWLIGTQSIKVYRPARDPAKE